ncbi:coiled-coil domain-containing protein 81 [Bufo gargarizans]|uniref:coiled-coil domain-containing protein 81 n=1 Tax=Bufo gargarizans TaxID=30331 RepID=UPI001CF23DBE|nr:coiled-coil domain-containing protein 81 [Bufo gargarizans]
MLDFLQDAGRSGFQTLQSLTEEDVCAIWASVSEFVEHQMSLQKGVQIPGLGTFTLSRQKLDVGNNKFIIMQRPVFLLSEKLAQVHGLKFNKVFTTGDIPIVPLNFIALSFACPYNRDTIEACVRETLGAFSRSIATKQNVEFTFRSIGALIIRDLKVKMKFYKEFVNSMDGTGAVVKSLCNRPGTADSVMSSGEDQMLRPRSCSALLFPRIDMKGTEKSTGMETIPEENGEVGSVEEPKCDQQPDREEETDKEEPFSSRRENSATKRLLNRQYIVPARVTAISLSEDIIPKPKTAPERLGSPASMNIPRAGPEVNQTTVLQIRPPPACLDHCRAGQELCYLCLQRAQKNIPVYFTEERKLREREEERVLQQYQHMKDQEAILKSQLEAHVNREEREKDAAYNKGVAEATRNGRNGRSTEFYRSYIFQKRPLTPPALLKQEQYYQSLTKQMADRRGKEVKEKQDQDLLARLEHVQLAEELAAQRAKFLRAKTEQIHSYKNALDTQVKIKPSFALPPASEATEPVFGCNDMTSDKLVERKRRAQEVYKHQLQAAAERKRLTILNDLVQQRKEADMLQRSKELFLSDRAVQFGKIHRLQKTLQEDWTRSSEIKRQKEHKEELYMQAGSELLLDQCEKYRRCFQCKRRTSNCGETNVWCESRYIPGSRLMV